MLRRGGRRAYPAQGHSLGAESQSLVAWGTFRAQWNNHCVWPYLRGLARVCLAHFGIFRTAAFGVMARNTRPHIHFLPGSKPQTQKRTGERRGGLVGRLGALQSGSSGLEPQHPHHTVVWVSVSLLGSGVSSGGTLLAECQVKLPGEFYHLELDIGTAWISQKVTQWLSPFSMRKGCLDSQQPHLLLNSVWSVPWPLPTPAATSTAPLVFKQRKVVFVDHSFGGGKGM